MYPVSFLASPGTSYRPATLPLLRLDCLSYHLSYWFITINWLLRLCCLYVSGSSGAGLFRRSLKCSTYLFSSSSANVYMFPSLPLIPLPVNLYYPLLLVFLVLPWAAACPAFLAKSVSILLLLSLLILLLTSLWALVYCYCPSASLALALHVFNITFFLLLYGTLRRVSPYIMSLYWAYILSTVSLHVSAHIFFFLFPFSFKLNVFIVIMLLQHLVPIGDLDLKLSLMSPC